MQHNNETTNGFRILSSSLTRLKIFRMEQQIAERACISQYLTSGGIATSSTAKQRERKERAENLR